MSKQLQQQQQQRRKVRPEISEEQLLEIKEAFDLFDMNKDKYLDFHELKVAMRALGFDMKKEQVLRLLKENDREGRHLMSYDDFQRIMAQKISERDPLEEIRKAFRLFDDDGSGKINLKKLRRVAKELGEDIEDQELASMIDEFDLVSTMISFYPLIYP